MAGRGRLRCQLDGLLQQLRRAVEIAGRDALGGLLAQVVGAPRAVAGLVGFVELLRHGRGLRPVARALVQGEQGQPRLGVVARAVERLVGGFGAVEQAGLQEVLRQRVLGAVALGAAQVGAAEQVLVHAHRALVLAAAAEQVAEREVQVGGVGVVAAPPR